MTAIFQNPRLSLDPLMTVGKQVVESIKARNRRNQELYSVAKLTVSDMRKEAIDWFKRVQMPQPTRVFSSYPHELSGGMCQRAMIAVALACKPKLLIADEPTTALDVSVEQSLLALLKKIQKKMGMSIIFISHDLNIVRKISDRVLVMQKGEIKEENSMNEIFQNPKDPYTQRLINSSPEPKKGTIDFNDEILKISALDLIYSKKDFIGRKSYFSALKNINLTVKKNSALGLV